MRFLFAFIINIALFFAIVYFYDKLADIKGKKMKLNDNTAPYVKKIYYITLAAVAVVCLIIFLIVALSLNNAHTTTTFGKILIFLTMIVKSLIFSEYITNIIYKRIDLNLYMGERKFPLVNAGRVNKRLLTILAAADGIASIICALVICI